MRSGFEQELPKNLVSDFQRVGAVIEKAVAPPGSVLGLRSQAWVPQWGAGNPGSSLGPEAGHWSMSLTTWQN